MFPEPVMTREKRCAPCAVLPYGSSAGCALRVGVSVCSDARAMSPQQLLPLGLLLSGASVSALRQPIGRITSLNRNRLVADEDDSQFYRAPRLVNHADGAA